MPNNAPQQQMQPIRTLRLYGITKKEKSPVPQSNPRNLFNDHFHVGMTKAEVHAVIQNMVRTMAATEQNAFFSEAVVGNNILHRASHQAEKMVGLLGALNKAGNELGKNYQPNPYLHADLTGTQEANVVLTGSAAGPTASLTGTKSAPSAELAAKQDGGSGAALNFEAQEGAKPTVKGEDQLLTTEELAKYVAVCTKVALAAAQDIESGINHGNSIMRLGQPEKVLEYYWQKERKEREEERHKRKEEALKASGGKGAELSGTDGSVVLQGTNKAEPSAQESGSPETEAEKLGKKEQEWITEHHADREDLGDFPAAWRATKDKASMGDDMIVGSSYENLTALRTGGERSDGERFKRSLGYAAGVTSLVDLVHGVRQARDYVHDVSRQHLYIDTIMQSDSIRDIKAWDGDMANIGAGGSRARRGRDDEWYDPGLVRWMQECWSGNAKTSWHRQPHPDGQGDRVSFPLYYPAFSSGGPDSRQRRNMRDNIHDLLSIKYNRGEIGKGNILKFTEEAIPPGVSYGIMELEFALGAKALALEKGEDIKVQLGKNGKVVTITGPQKDENGNILLDPATGRPMMQFSAQERALFQEVYNRPPSGTSKKDYFTPQYKEQYNKLLQNREAAGQLDIFAKQVGVEDLKSGEGALMGMIAHEVSRRDMRVNHVFEKKQQTVLNEYAAMKEKGEWLKLDKTQLVEQAGAQEVLGGKVGPEAGVAMHLTTAGAQILVYNKVAAKNDKNSKLDLTEEQKNEYNKRVETAQQAAEERKQNAQIPEEKIQRSNSTNPSSRTQ